jgi:hypothetical protein
MLAGFREALAPSLFPPEAKANIKIRSERK